MENNSNSQESSIFRRVMTVVVSLLAGVLLFVGIKLSVVAGNKVVIPAISKALDDRAKDKEEIARLVSFATWIFESVSDPDSFVFESAGISGEYACIKYRVRNESGGMIRQFVIVKSNGELSDGSIEYKICSNVLKDHADKVNLALRNK